MFVYTLVQNRKSFPSNVDNYKLVFLNVTRPKSITSAHKYVLPTLLELKCNVTFCHSMTKATMTIFEYSTTIILYSTETSVCNE